MSSIIELVAEKRLDIIFKHITTIEFKQTTQAQTQYKIRAMQSNVKKPS